MQSIIDLQDFQDAEPDVIAHCASAIIERFNEDGMQFDAALKALCRKRKGLVVEVKVSLDNACTIFIFLSSNFCCCLLIVFFTAWQYHIAFVILIYLAFI